MIRLSVGVLGMNTAEAMWYSPQGIISGLDDVCLTTGAVNLEP